MKLNTLYKPNNLKPLDMMNKTVYFFVILSFLIYSCKQKEKQDPIQTTEKTPLEIGQNIAMQTKGVLGKNLLHAIKSEGTENAITFCSSKAIPLTDSVALSLHAKIKRVSDKNRNPDNKANEAELDYIYTTKEAISKGETVKPKLTAVGNKQIAYYPIMTNDMCLQCHGQPEKDISANTLSKISELYPDDKAVGYKTDELRGIWVVEMDKKR